MVETVNVPYIRFSQTTGQSLTAETNEYWKSLDHKLHRFYFITVINMNVLTTDCIPIMIFAVVLLVLVQCQIKAEPVLFKSSSFFS